MSKRVSLCLNQTQLKLLNGLLRTGLYGFSLAQVVRRLLDQKLEEKFYERPNK